MKRAHVILPVNPKGVDAAIQEVINLLNNVSDPYNGGLMMFDDGLLFGKAERDSEKNTPLVAGSKRDEQLPFFDNYRITGFFYESDPRPTNQGFTTYSLSLLVRYNQDKFTTDDNRIRESLINAVLRKFRVSFTEDDFESIQVHTDSNGVWGNYNLDNLNKKGFFKKPWDQFRVSFNYTRAIDC